VTIKYIGSKRRLVPALGALCARVGTKTALDLFTGTTRVAQAFKRHGARVTAVDAARYSETLARCYVEIDARTVDQPALDAAIDHLNRLPGGPGYVTETFCIKSRYFQPFNGERIDAMRQSIADNFAGSPLEPLLLTSLLEAADRVDSTTGLQMAYLKQWSPRSYQPIELRAPVLLPGTGRAIRGDAVALAPTLPATDLAYLDPPYNQHRYFTNYHVWETLVAWDAPDHYGVACKRADARHPSTRSPFNRRQEIAGALATVISAVDARLLVVSFSDEGWVPINHVVEMCADRGDVRVVAFPSKRYVGAQIGIYNPRGQRVGRISHLRNTEYLVVAGHHAAVRRAVGDGLSCPLPGALPAPLLRSAPPSPRSRPLRRG
jgi:adenine-specific DNA-methyltransferase